MAGIKILCILFFMNEISGLDLNKVLILGRHNIRAPLNSHLGRLTPKKFPKWKEDIGFLTQKGALMEQFMGEHIGDWLRKEKLFTNECPNHNEVFVYSNSPQRTRESAKNFASYAFKNCNISTHYRSDVLVDPVFHPVLINPSITMRDTILKEMQQKLDQLDLEDVYKILNDILNIKNSEICRNESVCDLSEAKDQIMYVIGEEPDVKGPLHIGNAVVDSFLMSYYNGDAENVIGWGQIKKEHWPLFAKITKENQNVRFNSTIIAKEVAKPLLSYIYNILIDENPRFSLLVGHDSNLNSVMASLGVEAYDLDEQNEKTPVGGKLVFQKWHDKTLNEYFFKLNYIYQSTEQLRNGTPVTSKNPPKSVLLTIKNCSTDKNGFCPWKDFIGMYENIVKSME